MRKRPISLVLAMLLIAAFLPVNATMATPDLTMKVGEEIPVAVAPYGQVQPEIDYPWIVWKDERAGQNNILTDIYAYNFETREETIVCAAPGENSNPDISGTRVVYSDDRHDPDASTSNDCNIMMYDLATGVETTICDAPNGQGNPSIDGDIIAWVDRRNSDDWESDIYMLDLSTGVESVVTTAPGSQNGPTVSGDRVVWTDGSGNGTGGVYLRDMSTGETKQLDTYSFVSWPYNYHAAADPSVWGDYVAWSVTHQWHDGTTYQIEESIKLYDVQSSVTTTISSTTQDSRWHPVVNDGWVVWPDDRGDNGREVWGYNLESREETMLVASVEQEADDWTYAGRATVADGILAWHDHRTEPDGDSEHADLYAKLLADTWAPEITISGVADGEDYSAPVTPVVTSTDPSATIMATLNGNPFTLGDAISQSGDFSLVVVAEDTAGNTTQRTLSFSVDISTETPCERVTGYDRYDVGCTVSSSRFGTADTVLITTGESFPDAVSASGLAGYYHAPVLLVRRDSVPSAVKREIERLGASRAVIVGGEYSVGASVEDALESMDLDVERIAGRDRYEVSRNVATRLATLVGDELSDTLYITRGDLYTDALSVSPLAYGGHAPVVLSKTAGLSGGTGEMIERLGFDKVVIVGGADSISPQVERSLKALGLSVHRISGADRYEASYNTAVYGYQNDILDPGYVSVATGRNFPDALTGGVAAGEAGGVMMLTTPDDLHPWARKLLMDNKDEITQFLVIGGPKSVSPKVMETADSILNPLP